MQPRVHHRNRDVTGRTTIFQSMPNGCIWPGTSSAEPVAARISAFLTETSFSRKHEATPLRSLSCTAYFPEENPKKRNGRAVLPPSGSSAPRLPKSSSQDRLFKRRFSFHQKSPPYPKIRRTSVIKGCRSYWRSFSHSSWQERRSSGNWRNGHWTSAGRR